MNGLLRIVGWFFFPMFRVLKLSLCVLIPALAALALGASVWGWRPAGQSQLADPVPATLQEAVAAACSEVPRALPAPQRALRPTLVLPRAGDRELLMTQGIREALERDGGYRPVDQSLARELLDELFDLAGAPRQPVADAPTALGLAKAAGAEVVMFGHVERLALRDRRAEVSFSLQAFELGGEQPLLAGEFPALRPGSLRTATKLPWAMRLGVLAVAVVWPLLTIPVMARVLRMDSNAATLLTILAVTAVPALVAWPQFFAEPVGPGRILAYAFAVLLAGFWSALVMSRVAAREDGG